MKLPETCLICGAGAAWIPFEATTMVQCGACRGYTVERVETARVALNALSEEDRWRLGWTTCVASLAGIPGMLSLSRIELLLQRGPAFGHGAALDRLVSYIDASATVGTDVNLRDDLWTTWWVGGRAGAAALCDQAHVAQLIRYSREDGDRAYGRLTATGAEVARALRAGRVGYLEQNHTYAAVLRSVLSAPAP